MSKTKEALKMALEAMEENWRSDKSEAAIKCIHKALAEQEQEQEQEPVAWMSPGKERLEFARVDTVYGSHTIPLYTHDAPASKQASHPIPADISADLERSDWTAEEALRWYAAGKHYDTVPNGDGTSSARILDNGAVASNALKSMSIEYATLKGDVALTEAPAQCPVIEDQVPAAYFATHPNVTDRCDGGKPRMLRKEHVVNYLHSGWRVWAVMDDIAITAPVPAQWQELSEEETTELLARHEGTVRDLLADHAAVLRAKNGATK